MAEGLFSAADLILQRLMRGEPVTQAFPIRIPVSYGESADAAVVQWLLRQVGWQVKVDGQFGPASRRQLMDFQKSQFGWADGVCTPGGKTIARLVKLYAEGRRTQHSFVHHPARQILGRPEDPAGQASNPIFPPPSRPVKL